VTSGRVHCQWLPKYPRKEEAAVAYDIANLWRAVKGIAEVTEKNVSSVPLPSSQQGWCSAFWNCRPQPAAARVCAAAKSPTYCTPARLSLPLPCS
jgi:hypothetical protein